MRTSPEETWRKIHAYATRRDSMFTVRRQIKGKTYYVLLHVKGGTEVEFTSDEVEVWLAGYVTGMRAQLAADERRESAEKDIEALVEANKRQNEIVSVEILAEG